MNQERWTITVAVIKGIPIRLHLTFLAFLAALVIPGADSAHGAALELLFLLGIFGCIALHELGHALAASWFGIKTRDIVIYPFGGIASITASPAPLAELIIAVAGPLVNVIIAAVLLLSFDYTELLIGTPILGRLLIANIFLAVFNMIPAIPMDGGRVLRSLLMLANFRRATLVATRISQIISLGFIGLALYSGRVDLLLVGVVVFIGALQEQVHTQARRAVGRHTVADVMIAADKLQSFSHGTTLAAALEIALRSFQDFFPVLVGVQVRGLVSKDDLLQFAASNEENTYIQEVAQKDFPRVTRNQELATLLDPSQPYHDFPVMIVENEGGDFVGMLLREKIIEMMLIDELKRRMDNGKALDGSPLA